MTTVSGFVGLPHPDVRVRLGSSGQALLDQLIGQIEAKARRNIIRRDWYDAKAVQRDLGIAIPPTLRDLDSCLGWAGKAVDYLARRIRFEGVVFPGGDQFGVADLVGSADMQGISDEATVSALIHASAFLLVFEGDASLGEPPVVVSAHDALSATGVWSVARRGLTAGLVVADRDQYGSAVRYLLLTDAQVADIRLVGGVWSVEVRQHNLGRVPLEPLTYRRRTGRPFGSSRISRAVMSISESAMRTAARSEIGAEFFSAPQRYLLGADEEAFAGEDGRGGLWRLVMGRMLAYPEASDSDGKPLQIGQFPQISMQPHMDQMRMWAMLFAAETGLPVSALGVVQDNPSSAEAIFASKEDLIVEAEGCARNFSTAWKRVVTLAVQLRDHLASPPDGISTMAIRWGDASTPSRAQATDAAIKLVSAGILPADADVTLEGLGYDSDTIARIDAHRAAAPPQGLSALAAAIAKG